MKDLRKRKMARNYNLRRRIKKLYHYHGFDIEAISNLTNIPQDEVRAILEINDPNKDGGN